MTMGLKEVVSDGPLIWMIPSIGFGYATIGLKKSLGVGAEKTIIALYNKGEENEILGTLW